MQSNNNYNINGRFNLVVVSCLLVLFFIVSCNKLVQVPNPISSVTSNQVFSSDATATAAMLGIYSYMTGKRMSFSNSLTTAYLGRSADELTDEPSGSEIYDDFLVNHLTVIMDGGAVEGDIWQPAYFDIYSANAVIAALQAFTGVSTGTRNQLIGEAKFIRAFCYFYLTNIFGGVPLDLTPDFNQTVLLKKSSDSEVYQQISSDLVDAQNLMISDFSLTDGMPIRANKWAAAALLARIYLYQGLWHRADSAATAVINSGQFSLVGLDSVFLANSSEAILQLQTQTINSPYATWEGNQFVPYRTSSIPNYWLTSQLLGAFEPNDLRRTAWVDSNIAYDGNTYYYPYKYKINFGMAGVPAEENYTLLRLAEQYLIRAEAEANLNQLGSAISDINTIRIRAGLDSLSSSLTQTQVITAVKQEYRVEFFAEWGHRWMDLKRWGIALDTLGAIPYKARYIDSFQMLYPIPITETQTDPNLVQNSGY